MSRRSRVIYGSLGAFVAISAFYILLAFSNGDGSSTMDYSEAMLTVWFVSIFLAACLWTMGILAWLLQLFGPNRGAARGGGVVKDVVDGPLKDGSPQSVVGPLFLSGLLILLIGTSLCFSGVA